MEENKPARLVDLPPAVRGFCYHDNDGEDYIVLNSRLTWEQNLDTYLHEQDHIQHGDLCDLSYNEYGGIEP